jgi:hypothetical protein
VTRQLTLRNRVEVLWYNPREKERTQQGFITYFDASFKPLSKPISLNGRLLYFETDGFDSRIYTFENDVLYSFSIPAFSGKGLRYYFNLNYDVSKKLTTWFRWAQTIYQNRETVGSGLDVIEGNKRTDVKVQLLYNF